MEDKNNIEGGHKYILEFKDVDKSYGDKSVLRDIDLNVRKGELVSVVGPSGCGKSTLLKLLLGSLKKTSGEILENGKPITKISRNRGIVFQQYSIFPFMTVEKNILFGLELEYFNYFEHILHKLFGFVQKKKRKEFADLAHKYLKIVGLFEHKDKYPNQLSGGQKQRVAIAQAMVMHPDILMMDEPFGALDAVTRMELQDFTKKLTTEMNQTVFFVTHDLDEALTMGDRLLVISQYWEKGDVHGAKIVLDMALDWGDIEIKDLEQHPEFLRLKAKVKYAGLNPDILQSLDEFDLSHEDSIIDHNFKL